ncbi:hypothetical protein [Hypericibacter sp.]|uniref:hypothetical protein n=1 Tax=Hypericibacter sp. TaxID=2705401 RepID=UPI003D6D58ED
MRRADRTALAFILVPLIPVALLRPLVADDFPTAFSDLSMRHVGSPGAMLSYSIALLALPGHRFLLARGWTGFLAYAALGPAAVAVAFLIRFLANILVVRSGLVFLPLAYTLKGLPEALAYGLFASTLFWLIARPDRPDKPQPSRPGALPNAAPSLTRTTTEGPPSDGSER